MAKFDALPPNLPPRGLSRDVAAQYIGVAATTFDKLVEDGRAPKPRRIDGRKVWDRLALDMAFDALPIDGVASANNNPFDGTTV